jgi:hypothetical protein
MQVLELNEQYSVVCNFKKTRTAFKHEATIMRDGLAAYSTKICYQNRTWESYEFESVLHKAIEGFFSEGTAEEIKAILKEREEKRTSSRFNSVAGVAMLGNIFCNTPEDKNNWKMRMLKAGMPGFDPPADWDALPENEKERRLDLAINSLTT